MGTKLFKSVILMVIALCSVQFVHGTTNMGGTSMELMAENKSDEKVDSIPQFSIKKLTILNEQGDTMRYEDGSVKYYYIVTDKDGKACDPETAKKLTNAALKAGLTILLKVGGSAAAGGGLGKALGGKKGGWIGSAVGAAAGLALSAGDIKKVKENTSLLEKYKAALKQYQETFTEEGLPKDASADLSAYNDCEELTASAQEIREQIAASKEQGATLEDISEEELQKMMDDVVKNKKAA